MQVFELHFNPKKRSDIYITSFVYNPANLYEKRLGILCVAGELNQALPQNSHFLANLSSVIKKEYYSAGLKKSCEASLKDALKKGNEFLNQESKNGNVAWLGNLNFIVLALKDYHLQFAKAGDIKIFLMRNKALIDLCQSLEKELPAPDPLKVFGSMAGGKISEEDKIIILNKKNLLAFGKKQKLLEELAGAANEKEFKRIFKIHQEILENISGIGLVLAPAGENAAKQTINLQNKLPHFSFKFKIPKIGIPQIKITRPKLPSLPRLPRINLKTLRKKLLLIASLILVLTSFYYIFRGERCREIKDAQTRLNIAEEKFMLAESLLILKENGKANALFEESLQILSPLTKKGRAPNSLYEKALSLQKSIKEYLK